MARQPPRPGDSIGRTELSWKDLQDRAVRENRTSLELIAEHVLPSLHRRLRWAFPASAGDVLHDGLIDAFIDYAHRREGFDSSSGQPLDRFLYRAEWRNVADSLRSDLLRQSRQERYAKEASLSGAAMKLNDRSLAIDADMIRRILDGGLNDPEREALGRWLAGERRTEPLAQALGLTARGESLICHGLLNSPWSESQK